MALQSLSGLDGHRIFICVCCNNMIIINRTNVQDMSSDRRVLPLKLLFILTHNKSEEYSIVLNKGTFITNSALQSKIHYR